MIDKKFFWNKKILNWEKDKYFKNNSILGVDPNESVKFRQQLAKKILLNFGQNKKILEIGCGSGLLFDEIKKSNCASYLGIDFSTTAIEQALLKISKSDQNKFSFQTADVNQFKFPNSDLVFSLGLLDWLEPKDIQNLFKNQNTQYFFHSFSEKKNNISQNLHRLYVMTLYGYKTKTYTPQYMTELEILSLFEPQSHKIKFFRHPKLSFGCVVYNLPFNIEDLL